MAYACLQSVPLVKQDTLDVLTGLKALVQWQSTLLWVKNPPANWPFPPVDLVGGLQDLTQKVEDGTITQEIDFETQLVDLITSVRDGHFTYVPDAYSVFQYANAQLPIVSVSADGKQLPEIYAAFDLLAQYTGDAEGWAPSPIVKINGTDPVSLLSKLAFNGTLTHQDLDALYNREFFTPFASGGQGEFSTPSMSRYSGSSIAVEFKNGSQASFPILAYLTYDFTNVVDGESFYQTFCNATVKAMASASASSAPTAQPTATPAADPNTLWPFYPSAAVISSDGQVAGYFLDDAPSVAILAVHSMSETAQLSVQQTVARFLQQCRQANKTHLIVDLTQNPGGTVGLAYDIFKQLFPSIQPYLGAQLRAQEQANILGQFYTTALQQAEQENDIDLSNDVILQGIYSAFDATSIYNDSGLPFPSWADYFGPVQVHGDNFAHQYQLNLSNAGYDEATAGIVPFGYANNSKVAPQPFLPENIITFTDGFCASACTILAHLLKYQGKVKSIVAGGRPQTGPMQAIGGVKGCEVQPLLGLMGNVDTFYQNASAEAISAANQTELKDLADQGNTLMLRQDPTNGIVNVNLLNAIAQYDESQTPLQFVYEAADCRLWFQPGHLFDVTAMWSLVAEQAFALNGTEKFSLCVPGSTNQPSSLSGNQTLFQGGQPSNVTGYNPEGQEAAQSTSEQNASASLTFAAGSLSSMALGIFLAVIAASANLII
ncbi:uncharacterized protein Z520_06135 [Fonsecaea multimorphosa CBS 102226]|uniref:Uncharacterized protein n=1 Tax=Fonsecaea multimorphosa CBS 102226 TaxID=1442371 RepID=A0A0D2IM19_9EURO|nr:uncharacterized protein Z520_06135 [Fonsecaea multimorphosa CBS 102226]KIX98056.1 hypothetical protein Z520_06135 [Fonsecaea multimorphosa CBS 102226]